MSQSNEELIWDCINSSIAAHQIEIDTSILANNLVRERVTRFALESIIDIVECYAYETKEG